jgi:sialic acid synthase SpsE
MSCFVIAECGVNWRDLVDADQMIKAASEAGADAVKFQAYEEISEYQPAFETKIMHSGGSSTLEIIPAKGHIRSDELNAIRLDESTIRYLYWRCRQHDIELMVTPMYPEAVAMLDPYVKRWKVRYADRENEDLIRLCTTGAKEILISTDIPLDWHKYVFSNIICKAKYLYCCSEYPPAHQTTRGMVAGFDGYSCHIPEIHHILDITDVSGIDYLEVHVRLDHYEPPHYCPIDTAVSITMSELAELCRRLKQ